MIYPNNGDYLCAVVKHRKILFIFRGDNVENQREEKDEIIDFLVAKFPRKDPN